MRHGFVTPLLRNPGGAHRLWNERTGEVLADRLLPAFESKARRTGLLKHDSLPDGHAMVIAPTNAVHTCFMRFPIDLAFVSKDGRVVKLRESVKPWRLAAAFGAFAVVELPAGTLSRSSTLVGDTVSIKP